MRIETKSLNDLNNQNSIIMSWIVLSQVGNNINRVDWLRIESLNNLDKPNHIIMSWTIPSHNNEKIDNFGLLKLGRN